MRARGKKALKNAKKGSDNRSGFSGRTHMLSRARTDMTQMMLKRMRKLHWDGDMRRRCFKA